MSVNIKENGQLVKTAGLNSQTVIIDNLTTQDSTKALSAKQGYVLNQNKVDKVSGKGLSTNDYTNEEKTKLAGISAGAEPNVQSDWKQSDSSSDDFIKNKPTSDIKTSNNGQFTTVTGGLMQKCEVDLDPIQSGSGTPSPSNVRPITGHAQVQVGNCGKNKLPLTVANVKSASTAGTWSGNKYTINGVTYELFANEDGAITSIKATGTATADAPLVLYRNLSLPNGSYMLSGSPSGGSMTSYRVYSTGVSASDTGGGSSFVVSSGQSATVACMISNGYAIPSNGVIFKPQIEVGSTKTDFEPYNSYTITINLDGTYYGGILDAVSGVLKVTHGFATIDGSKVTGVSSASTTDTLGGKRINTNITNAKYAGSGSAVPNVISDKLSVASATDIYGTNVPNRVSVNDVGGITLRYNGASTLADAQTALNSSPVQVCYELATPQTIQLTLTQLETLVGQNDVFAPLVGQSVEKVEYREVLAIDDVIDAIPYESVSPDVGTGEMFTYFKIYRYGRVVVLTFMQDSMIEIPTQATRKIFGVLPERFYTKKSGAMPYNTIKYTFINQKGFGVFAPKLLEIDPTNGNVYADYEADEGICPMGSLTYILDHD